MILASERWNVFDRAIGGANRLCREMTLLPARLLPNAFTRFVSFVLLPSAGTAVGAGLVGGLLVLPFAAVALIGGEPTVSALAGNALSTLARATGWPVVMGAAAVSGAGLAVAHSVVGRQQEARKATRDIFTQLRASSGLGGHYSRARMIAERRDMQAGGAEDWRSLVALRDQYAAFADGVWKGEYRLRSLGGMDKQAILNDVGRHPSLTHTVVDRQIGAETLRKVKDRPGCEGLNRLLRLWGVPAPTPEAVAPDQVSRARSEAMPEGTEQTGAATAAPAQLPASADFGMVTLAAPTQEAASRLSDQEKG